MVDTTLGADEKALLAARLNDAASQLDEQIANASTADDALALDEIATALRNQGTRLIAQAIVLRQNDTGLDATLLAHAADHCLLVMARVAQVKKSIQVGTALLGFVPVLLAGDVPKIVKAGIALNKSLTAIEEA